MYRNRRPDSRRDRRKVSRRTRRRNEGPDWTLLLTLGAFAVIALILLVLIALALQPN